MSKWSHHLWWPPRETESEAKTSDNKNGNLWNNAKTWKHSIPHFLEYGIAQSCAVAILITDAVDPVLAQSCRANGKNGRLKLEVHLLCPRITFSHASHRRCVSICHGATLNKLQPHPLRGCNIYQMFSIWDPCLWQVDVLCWHSVLWEEKTSWNTNLAMLVYITHLPGFVSRSRPTWVTPQRNKSWSDPRWFFDHPMALQTYCPHLDHRQRRHQVLPLREPENGSW